MPDHPESSATGKEACPECRANGGDTSGNNLVRYDDGHGHCFACNYHEHASGEATKVERAPGLLDVHVPAAGLPRRRLTAETCARFAYGTGQDRNGVPVQIAQYRDKEGKIVGQKLRYQDKKGKGFPWVGTPKGVRPFGSHLWGKSKRIIVTEGEIDCMTVSQVLGHSWPVVSLINGAAGAAKDIASNLDYFRQFDEVVLLFDNDEAGIAGAQAAAKAAGNAIKLKIATPLPLKDANDMLLADRHREIMSHVFNAAGYRPDGLVRPSEIVEEALREPTLGYPWFLPALTELTYGRREGEVITLGAGTGVGKTDFLMQQAAYDLDVLGMKVALFFLEQPPAETLQRLAGKRDGALYHLLNGGWDGETRRAAIQRLGESQDLMLYKGAFGTGDWDEIKDLIRYLAVAEGYKVVYLDHLTALAEPSNERESLETLMKEAAGLAHELRIILVVVSHLSTPDGKPHEEGGRVMIRHFKGSRAIGFWSHFMLGLERDQQAEDDAEKHTSTLRCLKDRYTGRATGQTLALAYDQDTGLISEGVAPVATEETGPSGAGPSDF